jgi:hypothetical protein
MPRRLLPASLILPLLLLAVSAVHAQSGTTDLGVDVRLQAKGNLPNRARIGDHPPPSRSRIDSFSSAAVSGAAAAPAGRFSEFPSETSELSNAVQVP